MADIRAFRGFRYDLGRVGALSDVVAPPYDVIDPALQQALYDRSPYNVIRLELNREEPTDTETANRYTRAAGFLRDWVRDDVLVQDSARSIYVYHQDFEVEGKRYTRKGFMARVRLEPFGTGRIYPHEETLSGPKADRLKLYQATGMNLSQVFGLYPDPEGAVNAEIDRAVGRSLPLEAVDHLGVTSRLWPVHDQHAVSTLSGLLGPKPVFIADGHHRYETGLRYLEERRAAGDVTDPEAPANFILMMLVSMSDPGLVILPTHRLYSGLGNLRSEKLTELLSPYFDVQMVGTGDQAMRETWERIELDGTQAVMEVRHRRRRDLADCPLQGARRDGQTGGRPQPDLANAGGGGAAGAGDGPAGDAGAGCEADLQVRPPAPRGAGVDRGEGMSTGRAGAAGDDGPRRADRRQPGEDAAEVDLLLPEAAQRPGVQLAQESLTALLCVALLTLAPGEHTGGVCVSTSTRAGRTALAPGVFTGG
ncbi:MAG: DUF1015 domain-containing protein [Gemmataceae bacterium]